jgi:molybdopterin-containing oxidoreductase family iron-sulfur binding subunit
VNDGKWELASWFKNPERGSTPQDQWDLLKLRSNPDVSVRMRGVMEKCTFCLQRIEQAKIRQKVKAGASGNVEVKDGTIKTACQQVCPAEAIVFGNLKDPQSAVSHAQGQDRTYVVLDYLAVKPRVTYLARVRNPNPEMPDKYDMPYSTKEFLENGGSMHEHGDHGHAPAAGHHAEEKGAH